MPEQEHTPLTDADLDAIDPYMDWTGASMIVRMIDEIRETRRLLRAVSEDTTEDAERWGYGLSRSVVDDVRAYLAACEGK